MFLPHITACKVDAKLSSINIISAVSFALSQPFPIQNPTSAVSKASASLWLSPVTATTEPYFCIPTTSANLSYGVDLAKTFNFAIIY